jgi:cytochrome b
MTTLETDRRSSAVEYREAKTHRKVWDWPTRAFHWSLVASFAGAYATNKLGASYFSYHLFFGYAVIVLVAFRLIWGFVGTRHARFANFVERPRGVLRYVSALGRGRHTRYAGHNPVGALMIVALLALLGAQAVFGLFGNDEIFNVGPLASLVAKPTSLALTSLHRKLFNAILAAVGLHIGGVLAHVVWKREPLLRAMITGSKPSEWVDPEDSIASSRGALAVFLLLLLVGALAAGLQFVPSNDADLAGF